MFPSSDGMFPSYPLFYSASNQRFQRAALFYNAALARDKRDVIGTTIVWLPLTSAIHPRRKTGAEKLWKSFRKIPCQELAWNESNCITLHSKPHLVKSFRRRTGNRGSLPSYSADVQSRLVSSFLKLPQSSKTDFLHDRGSFLIDTVNKMLSGNISPNSKAVNYPCGTAFQVLPCFLFLFRISVFFKKMLITLFYP